MPARWAAHAPTGVRRLPMTIALPVVRHPEGVVVVGVRDGDLAPVGFTPSTGERRILVVGPAGSGRTTALMTLTRSFRANGHTVAVVGVGLDRRPEAGTGDKCATGDNRNHGDNRDHGAGYHTSASHKQGDHLGTASTHDNLLAITGTQPADLERLVEARRRHPELVVLVDDAERLAGLPIEPVLLEIARRVDEDRGAVVVATSTVAFEARTGALAHDLAVARTGLLLQPTTGTRVLGASITGETARIPGRGVLVTDRATHVVQVADPR
jgi:S-DNA-T family DNA segregation ATPase FtsK/SpoIIIE